MVADFEKTVREICTRRGIGCDFSCSVPYLPVVNRAEDYEKVRSLVTENCGKDAFFELPEHTMSSEDFSWYLQKYHGVFCHLGSGESAQLHSQQFDFNDDLLAVGIRYFCLLAFRMFE